LSTAGQPENPALIQPKYLKFEMKNNICNLLLWGSVATLSSVAALAQEYPVTTSSRDFEHLSGGPAWQAGVNLSYVGGTSAKFQGVQSGDSDAYNVNVNAGTRVTLTDVWSLNLGLVSDNYFLGTVAGDPIPDAIHTLRLNTGVGYRWNDQWSFNVLVSPSLYRFEDVNGDDFGVSGGVVATFVQNPSLTWAFGMIGSPDSDVPVLPIAGVRWQINDHYILEVGMPKTRLTYKIEPNLAIYTGLDLNGTTFRTGEHLMPPNTPPLNNTAQYNNALVSYHDIRLGVGASYEFWRTVRAEVETGFSVYREINYKDIDQSVDFKPAPYVRLGLGVRF
jgi:hypothetical protein